MEDLRERDRQKQMEELQKQIQDLQLKLLQKEQSDVHAELLAQMKQLELQKAQQYQPRAPVLYTLPAKSEPKKQFVFRTRQGLTETELEARNQQRQRLLAFIDRELGVQ